jgi:hypothetical protein
MLFGYLPETRKTYSIYMINSKSKHASKTSLRHSTTKITMAVTKLQQITVVQKQQINYNNNKKYTLELQQFTVKT